MFQIDRHIFATALHYIPVRIRTLRVAHSLHPFNTNNFGTHIAEHHRRKWPWPNTGNLNNFVARQRTTRCTSASHQCFATKPEISSTKYPQSGLGMS